MDKGQENKGLIEISQRTLQANKEHLNALKVYTRKLEVELETFNKILDAVDTIDESDLDVGCFVTIPGSVRGTAPIATKELLSSESPFYEDALRRSRYQSFSEVHPMKTKELEALAEAVKAESYRRRALDMQKRGFPVFQSIDSQTTHALWLDAKGIDWDRIAEKVSAIYMTTRTAKECEIRWLGEQNPEFNHEPWGEEEVLKVKSFAAEFSDSRPDWVAVAKRLETRRTPLDCMRHATSRKSHQWTTEADERLLKAICMYGHDNWYPVARYVSEDVTPSQCSNRFQRTLDESIKRTAWSPEEDARLSAAVAAYGSSWVDVAASVFGRHNDQCRERWTEQLNPSINRGEWSEVEDRFLLNYVREHDNASWKEVSEHLRNGRTETMCRNRHAVLQRCANAIPAVPVVSSEAHVASVNQTAVPSDSAIASSSAFCSGSFFRSIHPCSTAPAPPHTECHRPNQFVFLEPVVGSNPAAHKPHRPHSSRHILRFKTATYDHDVVSSNTTTVPPSKKRKTRPRIAKSNKSSPSQTNILPSERDLL